MKQAMQIQRRINQLRAKKQILENLARRKRKADLKVQRAIAEEMRLKREIIRLKKEQSPIGRSVKRIRRRGLKSPQTKRRIKQLKSAWRSFQKFANKYGA